MFKKFIISILILTVVTVAFGLNESYAGLPGLPGLPAPPGLPGAPNVSVNLNGFLPAPPGVHVLVDSGRPYYVESDRRVYIERRPAKHYKKKHYKKHHKHDDDYDDHDHGRGRGRGHGKH